MARLSKPLIPDGPIQQYYDRLHAMHRAAGQPSVRQIQRATRGPRWPNGINSTTNHDAFVKPRLARWEIVQEIARRLGGDVNELAALWRRARKAQLNGGEPEVFDETADAPSHPVASPPVPRELPPDVLGFTGRDQPLKRLDDLLVIQLDRDPTAPAITAITGMAGVGKTSLAVHWGHGVRRHFPDGQLYLNLRGHSGGSPMCPLEALSNLLRSLGVPSEEIPVDEQVAGGRYRSLLADRKVLILLDDAVDAEQVRPLLPGGPGCLVMVTSRDRLSALAATHGVRRLSLEPLTPDEARCLLGRILGPDRADAEPRAVDELAEACTYLPLALHVAAVDLANRAMPTIAEYLAAFLAGDRLDALEVDGDERTGVRRAFDMSYRALDPEAQRLFRLAGLIPGPELTVEAAAAVAEVSVRQAGRLLERLAAAHLLNQRAPGRYGCHDLVREYAADRAGTQDSAADRHDALRRLYDWYLFAAGVAAKTLYPHRIRLPLPATSSPVPSGITDGAAASAWLDAERANLVAAIRHAAKHGPWHVVWQLADILRGYFWLGMHFVEWAETAQLALVAARADGDRRAEAAALLSIGDTDDRLNRRPVAIEHYTQALEVSRRAGWREGQTAALAKLGTGLSEAGRLLEAIDYYHQALALSQATGSRYGEAVTLGCMGRITWQLGRFEEAIGCLDRALALFRELGARQGEAAALDALGEVLYTCGRVDEATEHLNLARVIQEEVGDRGTEAYTMLTLAGIHNDKGQSAEAMELALAPLALARGMGDRRIEADALNAVGAILHRTGRHAEALDSFRQALELTQLTGYRWTEVKALIGLARAHAGLDQIEKAVDRAQQALRLAREFGFAMLEAQALLYATPAADPQVEVEPVS
ncbi:MAG TPA: tetratricopeptide repeat protein [Candidatus Limnocylindrales bacterium]